VLERKARKKSKKELADAFRSAVWERDKFRSRATGRPVFKSGDDWSKIGEVDHAIPRSLAPDRLYDVANGILLSREENRLRKVACIQMPEYQRFSYTGPDDRGEPQTFTWRDDTGRITKERIG